MPCWCQNNPKPPLSLIWGSLLCQRSEKEVDKVWNKVSGSFSADILNNIPVIWLWKQPLYCFVVPLHVFNCLTDSDQQSFGMRWAGRGPKPPPATSLFISTSDVTARSTRNSNLSRTLLTIWRSIHSQLKACQSILFTALLAFYIWYWNRSHIRATGNLDHVSLLVTSALQSSSPHVHAGSPVFYLFNQIFCLHRGLV